MPYPERLRAWIDSDDTENKINGRIIDALVLGVFYGALYGGPPGRGALGYHAQRLGFRARSAEGDAFETGFEAAQEEMERMQHIVEQDRRSGRSDPGPDLDSPQPLP